MYNQKKHLYDVGLLKLEKPSKQKTATVCAADGSDNPVGTEATVLGWGMTEDGSESHTLQEVNVAVISNAECNKQYNNRITEGMMCAGNGGGKDSCNGDSGGPLVTSDDTLIGFVSWGGKCGVHAGVYTRLTFQLHRQHGVVWIAYAGDVACVIYYWLVGYTIVGCWITRDIRCKLLTCV
ncbi:serine protease, putative [Phytophthora infestans T30-4]|uniref:Serine protease, putative n=1 Tax=Phytophthora infestans (strain T30-4) TaxID=403677 RepID=D0MX09_PHYIT|nr:serine protease, putative [Phytophthora infestans T30-4]EEY64172.1 serine protease, putative [Phytophthora infestans T30-4]|eukprot:XP_002907608.1 serine protease, putative [Phytophthora infestans T30-4]